MFHCCICNPVRNWKHCFFCTTVNTTLSDTPDADLVLIQPFYVSLGQLSHWNKNVGLNNSQSDAINIDNHVTTWCKFVPFVLSNGYTYGHNRNVYLHNAVFWSLWDFSFVCFMLEKVSLNPNNPSGHMWAECALGVGEIVFSLLPVNQSNTNQS